MPDWTLNARLEPNSNDARNSARKSLLFIQLFQVTLGEKSTKLHKPIPKDSMGRRIELLHVLNTNEI